MRSPERTLISPAHDWTADLPQTDHVRFFRETDWTHTSLGPLKEWDATLRLFVGFVFADSRAACLWWGPDAVAICNEGFKVMSARVHPTLMGRTYAQGFPELWPSISALFEEGRRLGTGQNVSSAAPLLVERNGWLEEAFFSGSFIPIGPPHAPLGFYNSVYEVTSQKLTDRRTSMLNSLAAVPAQNLDVVIAHIPATLKTNPNDIPLIMLYKFEQGARPSVLRLQGSAGLPEGHGLLVKSAHIESEFGLFPDMRRAGSEAVTVDHDDRFDCATWNGWGAPSRKIAILPITGGVRLCTFGYLIIGTNPYRPQDDLDQQFIRDVSRMVSGIVSAAVSFEDTKRRQDQLEADLAFSDLKLRHLMDHASVGMCHISLEGHMLWANDQYYRLSGKTAEEHVPQYGLFDAYMDEDRPRAEEAFGNLLAGVEHVDIELRTKRLYETPHGDIEPTYIHALAFPYRNSQTGEVESVMACTMDISKLKWAQSFQARLAAEAREAKRQQEAFIDVVSHEMRNPLSAIVHCADAITTAVEDCQAKIADIPVPCLEALTDNVQSAKIVLQCAHHQKRIIDDVLTLSKLDSMLLSITPAATKPSELIESVVNMFETELKSSNIHYEVVPDASLVKLAIDCVYLDPSRVTQVFINLLTNAIKFVKPSKQPSIKIRFGACRTTPRTMFPAEMFWATESKRNDEVANNPDWGTGEELYMTYSVSDSGIGLQSQEIVKIFERFRQANVRTHIKYGGSGLGLFISKELTEKQGGEVGVASVEGQGSTFGFYVKGRRVAQLPQTLSKSLQDDAVTEGAERQLKVLLVEDNVINQQVLGKQLRKAGCSVDVANHGQEALDVLEEKSFDVVLMDIEMPVLDGISATRTIRQKEFANEGPLGEAMTRIGTRLPIIAVTANVRKEQVDTALAAGADRLVQKPFKARDLVQLMKSLRPQLVAEMIEPPKPESARSQIP